MATTPEPRVEKEPAPKTPRFDLRSLLERLRLPGVTTQKLMAFHRKDLEALIAANERAVQALETVTRKQADMLVNVLHEWNEGAKDAVADKPGAERLNEATSRVQSAFSTALANLREMAEISAKSSEDVLGILNKRYREGLDELRASLRPKS
jgi:phasin family protein